MLKMTHYLSVLLLLISAPVLAQAPTVTAQQFVDLQQGDSDYPGFRRAHAKGMCVSGQFISNGNLHSYSTAAVFEAGITPFVGRISIAGNNPYAPDLKAPVRSFALSFNADNTQQWRVAMNTPPVMAVSNPHNFYQQIMAIKAGPKSIAEFFAAHPESEDFRVWKSSYVPTNSFAHETYHSINAFYLVNENKEHQAVRWAMKPANVTPVSVERFTGENALFNELQQRLANTPVVFDWEFTLAAPEDDENNPAKSWPNTRQKILAGQVVIEQWQAQSGGQCDDINFDPLVLPSGIQATKDPILRARSAAYAESYRRRAIESLTGQVKEGRDD
ncbi:catalase family peroxidase [Pseudoalteromonas sp. GB56]